MNKAKQSLKEIFAQFPGTDKETLHSYGNLYEEIFTNLFSDGDENRAILEIGVRDGSSAKSWREWLNQRGQDVFISGIDNLTENGAPNFNDTNSGWTEIRLFVGDTTNPPSVCKTVQNYSYNLIIDDGCHNHYAQVANFGRFSPCLKEKGLYVIEDIEDIKFGQEMVKVFGGQLFDFREVKKRHDDIIWVWRRDNPRPDNGVYFKGDQ